MRVISGFAKGIPLKIGNSKVIRPTTDRIKESLFNILGDLRDCRVIDLFAGLGALGIEALSRGSKEVYFFEIDRKNCLIIKENLERVMKSQQEEELVTKVYPMDYRKAITMLTGSFDYIFADPPYSHEGKLALELLENFDFLDLLKSDGQLILEHPKSLNIPMAYFQKMEFVQQRSFGITTFSFIRKKNE